MSDGVSRPRFCRSVAALVATGSIGILVLIPINEAAVSALPNAPAQPLFTSIIASLQPFVILVLGAAAGTFAAPRLGLVSLIAEKAGGGRPGTARLRRWRTLLALSVGVGIAAVMLDELSRPLWLPDAADFPPYAQSWSPQTLLFGVTYGGLTEEIMMRWGLMSLLAWILWRMRGKAPAAREGALLGGLIVAALLFAAGHLPLLGTMLPLTPGPVIRTLALNSAIGIWFGWLYWRHCLEMAMLGHAGVHCGFAIYAVAVMLIGALG